MSNEFNLFQPENGLGCPKMTQLLKCQAPRAFSGAKILVILKIGHKIEID